MAFKKKKYTSMLTNVLTLAFLSLSATETVCTYKGFFLKRDKNENGDRVLIDKHRLNRMCGRV